MFPYQDSKDSAVLQTSSVPVPKAFNRTYTRGLSIYRPATASGITYSSRVYLDASILVPDEMQESVALYRRLRADTSKCNSFLHNRRHAWRLYR